MMMMMMMMMTVVMVLMMLCDDDNDDDDDDDGGTWSQRNAISQRGIMEIAGWPNYSATAKMPSTRPRITFTIESKMRFPIDEDTDDGDENTLQN